MRNAVIVDAVRTAVGKGKPGGALSGIHPADLLSQVLVALEKRTGLDTELVDDVIGGCVTQSSEQAINISRSAVLGAGWPEKIPAVTIDRQCGSSQQAAHFAAQGVMAGAYDVVVACGVESMSRVPMYSSAQGGDVFGPKVAERYPEGLVNQGISAELITQKWGYSRAQLDEFAARSHELAYKATRNGEFDKEVLPVEVTDESGATSQHTVDETIRASTTAEGLSGLNTSFNTDRATSRFPDVDWKITPGNSSPLSDGASGILIMEEELAKELGFTPRARFHSFAVTGSDPLLMLTGPIPATEKVLAKSGLGIKDMDVYEVNEAFAPVPLAWAQEMGAEIEKLNPRGGAIALGHALGSSGTRLMTTMLHYLEATGGKYGLQTMCEGNGMANATIIECI